jgi:replicative DNA helicase
MILAYLSGVNEGHILDNTFMPGEEARVRTAAAIMTHFKDNLLIYHMPDPNVSQLNSNARRFAILHHLDFLAFDYIHSSPALLGEFQSMKVREDVALLLMSTTLKALANELEMLVFSGTQVNKEGEQMEFADQGALRGSIGPYKFLIA